MMNERNFGQQCDVCHSHRISLYYVYKPRQLFLCVYCLKKLRPDMYQKYSVKGLLDDSADTVLAKENL